MTKIEMRTEYLSLESEQEKADYLWQHRIGGAALCLSPNQYPRATPRHKTCPICGGTGKLNTVGGFNIVNDSQIVCEQCGANTVLTWSPSTAWRDWDDGNVFHADDQMSIFDFLRNEEGGK